MSPEATPIHEGNLGSKRLRDLGLTILGTPLEAILQEFQRELSACGVTKVRPHFYLSTEWGVPFDTISIAIPFYLVRLDLTDFHAERGGLVEGGGPSDILRYLRHEMGHVVNYAYRLYESPEWIGQFGDINLPYEEEYRPKPFSPQYVDHLPGWYAQKHPDEDWAETFAVWMTPGLNWRERYTHRAALAKLDYCERIMAELRDREPLTTAEDPDEDVGSLDSTLDEHYRAYALDKMNISADLNDALRAIFGEPGKDSPTTTRSAANLIRRLEGTISADVYRWTGWFPERARHILRELAELAEKRNATYAEEREAAVTIALTTFITALAVSQINDATT
jgi:Putative zinc-binding metallo-peptidase